MEQFTEQERFELFRMPVPIFNMPTHNMTYLIFDSATGQSIDADVQKQYRKLCNTNGLNRNMVLCVHQFNVLFIIYQITRLLARFKQYGLHYFDIHHSHFILTEDDQVALINCEALTSEVVHHRTITNDAREL